MGKMKNIYKRSFLIFIIGLILFSVKLVSVTYADALDKWEWRFPPTSSNLNAITYGNGIFMAVGDDNTILTSSDGITWTDKTNKAILELIKSDCSDDIIQLNDIVYGNGTFVVLGGVGQGSAQPQTPPISSDNCVSGYITICGFGIENVSVSIQGDSGSYQTKTDESGYYQICELPSGKYKIHPTLKGYIFNSLFEVVENPTNEVVNFSVPTYQTLLISKNKGKTWKEILLPTNLTKLTFGNGFFTAVGDDEAVWKSNDGIKWTPRTSMIEKKLTGIAFGKDTFVAVGDGIILTSDDGTVWEDKSSGWKDKTNKTSVPDFKAIIFGKNNFAGVMDIFGRNQSGKKIKNVFVSGKGKRFRAGLTKISTTLNAITYGNGNFVVVGNNGGIATSHAGNNWKTRESKIPNDLFGVAFGNHRFVAVGSGGTIIESDYIK